MPRFVEGFDTCPLFAKLGVFVATEESAKCGDVRNQFDGFMTIQSHFLGVLLLFFARFQIAPLIGLFEYLFA